MRHIICTLFSMQAPELSKAYEPFVNSFEDSKQEIIRCEETKPRFMAFLKIAQGLSFLQCCVHKYFTTQIIPACYLKISH